MRSTRIFISPMLTSLGSFFVIGADVDDSTTNDSGFNPSVFDKRRQASYASSQSISASSASPTHPRNSTPCNFKIAGGGGPFANDETDEKKREIRELFTILPVNEHIFNGLIFT